MTEAVDRSELRFRLEILEAQLLAVEQAVEVITMLAEADTPDTAQRALQDRFGLTDLQSQIILDLQFRRTTRSLRAVLREEVEALRVAARRQQLAD